VIEGVSQRTKRTKGLLNAFGELSLTHNETEDALDESKGEDGRRTRPVYRRVGTLPALKIVGVKTTASNPNDPTQSHTVNQDAVSEMNLREDQAKRIENMLKARGLTKEQIDSAHALLIRERFLAAGISGAKADELTVEAVTNDLCTGNNAVALAAAAAEAKIQFIDALPMHQAAMLRAGRKPQNSTQVTRQQRAESATVAAAAGEYSSAIRGRHSDDDVQQPLDDIISIYEDMNTKLERQRAFEHARNEARRIRKLTAKMRGPTLPEDDEPSEDERIRLEDEEEEEEEDEATRLKKILRQLGNRNAASASKMGASERTIKSSSGLPMDSYTARIFGQKRAEYATQAALSARNCDYEQGAVDNDKMDASKFDSDKEEVDGAYEAPTNLSFQPRKTKPEPIMPTPSARQRSAKTAAHIGELAESTQKPSSLMGDEDDEEVYDVYALVQEEIPTDSHATSAESGSSIMFGQSSSEEPEPVQVSVLNEEEIQELLRRHNNWYYEDDAAKSDSEVYDDLDETPSEIDYPSSESSENEDEDDDCENDDDYDEYDTYRRHRVKFRLPVSRKVQFAPADEEEDHYDYDWAENEPGYDHGHGGDDEAEEGDDLMAGYRSYGFDEYGRLHGKPSDSDYTKMSSWERQFAEHLRRAHGSKRDVPLQHDFVEDDDDDDEE